MIPPNKNFFVACSPLRTVNAGNQEQMSISISFFFNPVAGVVTFNMFHYANLLHSVYSVASLLRRVILWFAGDCRSNYTQEEIMNDCNKSWLGHGVY